MTCAWPVVKATRRTPRDRRQRRDLLRRRRGGPSAGARRRRRAPASRSRRRRRTARRSARPSDGVSTVPGQIALQRTPWRHEVGGDRLGQPDHRRLGGAVDEAVRHALHAGRRRRHVDDRAAAFAASMPGRNARMMRYIARTFSVEGEIPFLSLHSSDVAWWTKPAQLNSTSMARPRRPAPRSPRRRQHVQRARHDPVRGPAASPRRCRWPTRWRLPRHRPARSRGRCPGPPPSRSTACPAACRPSSVPPRRRAIFTAARPASMVGERENSLPHTPTHLFL